MSMRWIESKEGLKQAITEYKRGPLTPELVTAYWRSKLPGFEVPECDWTAEEIQRTMQVLNGDPQGLMVPDLEDITLQRLGQMYPRMANDSVRKDSPIMDTHQTREWIKVYAAIDCPNRNTTQEVAEKFAQAQGYLGGRLKIHSLASQASHDLTGRYLDEGATWSWLLGSSHAGKLIYAHFHSDGPMHVSWYLAPSSSPRGGWRFEEVKKA